MIGRQFTYYCLPEDLDLLQDTAWSGIEYELFAEERGAADSILPVRRLRLDYSDMGKETLFLLIAPAPLAAISLTWIEHAGVRFLDKEQSDVVEVGRCYTDGKILRSNRLWYSPAFQDRAGRHDKQKTFLDWVSQLFKTTKKHLTYDEKTKSWFGPNALDAYRQSRYILE